MIRELRGKIAEGQFEFSLCSYPSRPLVKIITLYEPDPDLWIDYRARRL